MSYGIKVSKAGFDVKVATNSNLILNSDLYGTMKIAQIGGNYIQTITINVPATVVGSNGAKYEASVTHGLGYTPAFFAVVQDTAAVAFNWQPVPAGGGYGPKRVYANGTTVVARVATQDGGTPAFTCTFKIVVFKEKIN